MRKLKQLSLFESKANDCEKNIIVAEPQLAGRHRSSFRIPSIYCVCLGATLRLSGGSAQVVAPFLALYCVPLDESRKESGGVFSTGVGQF